MMTGLQRFQYWLGSPRGAAWYFGVAYALIAVVSLSMCAGPARAQFADQMTWGGTGGGTTNAQTVTISNVGALADLLGVEIRFSPGATNTSATTLAASGLTATAIRKWSPAGLIALTGGELRSGVPVSVMYNGTFFILLSPQVAQPTPTQQVFLSGSGTYTVSTTLGQTPRQLRIRAVAGGGGGAGSGPTNGSNGGATSFGGFTLNPGVGATGDTNAGGAGGTGGSGTALRTPGGTGSGGSTTQNNTLGGFGGATPFGAGGSSTLGGGTGGAGVTNSGAGGAGGGEPSGTPGPGGGGGESYELIIDSPTTTYSYAVGAGGAGGAAGGGNAGGAGATGKIIVDEIYLRPPANDNELLPEGCRCAA